MNSVCDSKMQAAITGSMTLSCSCPASAAIVTVRSLPMTRKQTWFTTSGMTGLTLPGMIDEPGCIGGQVDLVQARSAGPRRAGAGRCRSSRA